MASAASRIADRVSKFSISVFGEFTALAQQHRAVNLGQGFPDFASPSFVRAAAVAALQADLTQYARSAGHPRLVHSVAGLYSRVFDRPIDALSEVLITNGATEAIQNACLAFLNPNEEAVVLGPHYDSYFPCIEMAQATPRCIPFRLRPSSAAASSAELRRTSADWAIDWTEVESMIKPGVTKMVICNNPHNPSGKVYSAEELGQLARLCNKYNLLCLSDEVYEFMTYPEPTGSNTGQAAEDANERGLALRIASFPGMFERTVTMGSAGKTFSVTGFKVGWNVGPSHLIKAMWQVHQYNVFSVATPLQEAVAHAIEQAPSVAVDSGTGNGTSYFAELRKMFIRKRDRLCDLLEQAGLPPVVPQGTYFVLADTSKIDFGYNPSTDGPHRDFAFAKFLIKEIGVAAIPPSVFYPDEHKHLASNWARFCFCKKDEVIEAAGERLQQLRQFQTTPAPLLRSRSGDI